MPSHPDASTEKGVLWVVAAPLGNPEDLSPRARATLASADLLLAEDTRSARRLLADASVSADGRAILSCFDGNEQARADEAVRRIAAGQSVALLSEAGTPLVSDPGFRVVTAVIGAGFPVRPVPGPSALLAALVGSGLPSDGFTFLGFPPRKAGARRRLFQQFKDHPLTLVLYESPMRAAETLDDLAETLGPDRPACLARELTKPYEEFVRGTLAALRERYRDNRPLGEVTLVVGGRTANAALADELSEDALAEAAARLLDSGLSARDVTDALTLQTGQPRRRLYTLVTRVVAKLGTKLGGNIDSEKS
jgi:16S rRNA (cytidine1402-2'-O)-methyltransferase